MANSIDQLLEWMEQLGQIQQNEREAAKRMLKESDLSPRLIEFAQEIEAFFEKNELNQKKDNQKKKENEEFFNALMDMANFDHYKHFEAYLNQIKISISEKRQEFEDKLHADKEEHKIAKNLQAAFKPESRVLDQMQLHVNEVLTMVHQLQTFKNQYQF